MPITHNIADLKRGLSDVARRQIPFGVSVGINKTLDDVKRNSDKRLARTLDRPTPFTLRAFRVKRSTKRRLTGSVAAQAIQGAYLAFAETGGDRTPKGRAIVVPVGQRVNKYGNLPRGAVKRLMGRANVFATEPGARLAGGIYQRTRQGLRLLVAFADRARYRKRLGFQDGARKTAAARLPHHVEQAIRAAIHTAR